METEQLERSQQVREISAEVTKKFKYQEEYVEERINLETENINRKLQLMGTDVQKNTEKIISMKPLENN